MGTTTTNYSFGLPTIDGDADSWGTQLNANWTKTDGLLSGSQDLSTLSVTTSVTLKGQGDLILSDADSSHSVSLQAAATIGTSYTLTLPAADGSNGQVLATDGSGNLSFTTISGFDGAFSSLSGTPTTIAGYGITDSPTATSDLTNDSGFITSADGGNAATLDGLDSSQFLRSDANDITTAQLTIRQSSIDRFITPEGNHAGSFRKSGDHTTNGIGTLEIQSDGGTGDSNLASISLHCAGSYATNFHLRHDAYVGLGGWSAASWRWYVYMPTGDMVAAGNVTAYSDERLKEDVTPLTNNLEKVQKLNGVRFKWKDMPEIVGNPNTYDFGVLAHEVEAVAPEAVHGSAHTSPDGDPYKTVAYDKLVPILIEAIKEQQTQIEEMRVELGELKNGSTK